MTLDQNLFLVFFLYGLAFFGMGLAMALEAGRSVALAEGRVLRPLAGFGMIHGTHEWLEAYLLMAQSMGIPLAAWLSGVRLLLLVGSFASLFLFGLQASRMVTRPLPGGLKRGAVALGLYSLIVISSAALAFRAGGLQSDALDVLARYLLAVPASMLAALGLYFTGQRSEQISPRLRQFLNQAAIGFMFYALTQLVVRAIPVFPASALNEASFRGAVGVPIQAARMAVAVWITVALMRATKETERLRQAELLSAQQARLAALEERESLRRDLLRHIVRAQEDERSRIARELHDETAQHLTAFSLELATLKNSLPRRAASARTVDVLLDLSRQVSQEIYRIMTDLRPSHLDDLGLVQAIHALVDRDYTPNDFSFRVEVSGNARRLDPIQETVLYRVAQEALTNVARHAQVREGCVELAYEEQRVRLRVSDRGRGFDPTEPFRPPRGWGLAGMRERVESLGGTLKIDSAPGRGTTVEVDIPLNAEEQP